MTLLELQEKIKSKTSFMIKKEGDDIRDSIMIIDGESFHLDGLERVFTLASN